jgi:hypothetical protein
MIGTNYIRNAKVLKDLLSKFTILIDVDLDLLPWLSKASELR